MASIYITVILLCRVIQALFYKRSSIEIKNVPMLIKYTSFRNAVSALFCTITLLICFNGFKCDILTFAFAMMSGISLFMCSAFGIYSMKYGTVSLNSMFSTAGMLIPILAGLFFFNQPISAMQWVGLAVFFVSVYLLIQSSKKIFNGFSFKAFLLLMGALVFNGTTMLAQQLFTRYVPSGDVSVFSFISFAVPAVLGIMIFPFMPNRSSCDTKMSKPLIACAFALAAAVFVINQLATLSTALVPPVILFTLINGGETIISTVVAAVVYKERLSARSVVGVLLGITSFVIIKAF